MSFSGDYFGDWNALPSLALGNGYDNGYGYGYGNGYDNGYGNGYGNGDGDGGWNFAGNLGPDDDFNWDDWVTGNLPDYNSIVDDSATGASVVDDSIIDNPIPGHSLNPAIGTSATGNWIPGNPVINNSATVIWTTGNLATGDSAIGNQIARNPVVASHIVGTPVAGKSVTGNWAVGNPVHGNQVTASQSHVVAHPVVGPSVMGRNPATASAQHVSPMTAEQQTYAQHQRAIVEAQAQAFARLQSQAAARARRQATAQQQTPSAMAAQRKQESIATVQQSRDMAAQRKQRAIAAARAQAAAQLAAGQVPAAAAAPTSFDAASSAFASYPSVTVPSSLNYQPTDNAVTNNSASITAVPAPAPIPSPPFQPHGIFPFMKLPQELQLIIFRFVWHTTPDTPPSGQTSYQQHLQFYSDPRHLRAQLRGLFKLGAISSEIRSVAYAEYFRCTQLYLRYDSFFRWNYSDSWHGSDQLTESMSLLWQDATLSPLLIEYVEHVAWHVGPVYHRQLCNTQRAALEWLKNCKNVKTLEIVVAMRSSHARPKDVRNLIQRKGRFANGRVPYSTFKFFRFFSWSINRLDVLRKKGSLDKVVISVEPFVNESTRVADRGTIDLEALLERSEWFQKFKRETMKTLLAPRKRKMDAKSEKTEERSFYKIEQHLGHINPCWHRSYQI